MAAWGYIRFTCRACGDRFWARLSDHAARMLCHECSPLEPSPVGRASAPDACGAAPPLAFRSKNADTAEHTHE